MGRSYKKVKANYYAKKFIDEAVALNCKSKPFDEYYDCLKDTKMKFLQAHIMQPDKYKPQNCQHLTDHHRHGNPVHDGYNWRCLNAAEGYNVENSNLVEDLKEIMIENKEIEVKD